MALFNDLKILDKNRNTLIIRVLRAQDVDAFLIYQAKIAAETNYTLQVAGIVPNPVDIVKVWNKTLNSSSSLNLGVFDNKNKMVAGLSFTLQNEEHPWVKHIATFGVTILKEFWGQGIGKSLLEAIEKHSKVVGVSKIEAKVRSRNIRAINLYLSFGYEIEGFRRNAAWIDGHFHHEYFIGKVL